MLAYIEISLYFFPSFSFWWCGRGGTYISPLYLMDSLIFVAQHYPINMDINGLEIGMQKILNNVCLVV